MADELVQPDLNESELELEPDAGSPEVYAQIYYRSRGLHKRVSIKNRREDVDPTELLESDLTISSSVYDVFELNESAGREEVSKVIETEADDDRTYELFVDNIIKRNGILPSVRERMLVDADLKNKFLGLVKLDKEDAADERQLEKDIRAFNESLAKYTGTASNGFVADSLATSRKRRWFIKVNSRILKNSEAGNKFIGSQRELYLRWKRGQLSNGRYHKELTKLYNETVEASGDEELKKMWKEEQEADYGMEIFKKFTVVDETAVKGEVPVSSDDITAVNSQVSSAMSDSGFNLSFNNSGVARVNTDYCSIDVSVYRKVDTGGFVYYVDDPFLNSGKIGPLKSAQMLPELLDSRQIDAYMTRRIADPVVQKDFSDLPDENVVGLAKKIIGSGFGRRNFKLRNEDRVVLDGLVSLLVSDK